MRKLINAGNLICLEDRGEIVCIFEPGGDGWACVFTTGNLAGAAHTYPSFQQAFNRAQKFIPWTNEGEYRS